jgi:hypothetical protein
MIPGMSAQQYMDMDLVDLADWCGINANPGSPEAEVARAVLTARLAAESARVAASVAKATWWLVAATWAVAAVTIVVAIASG